jgi:hypothetical protein
MQPRYASVVKLYVVQPKIEPKYVIKPGGVDLETPLPFGDDGDACHLPPNTQNDRKLLPMS